MPERFIKIRLDRPGFDNTRHLIKFHFSISYLTVEIKFVFYFFTLLNVFYFFTLLKAGRTQDGFANCSEKSVHTSTVIEFTKKLKIYEVVFGR